MFTNKTGNVVVDAELAKTNKEGATRKISYDIVDTEKSTPTFQDVVVALTQKGFTENVVLDEKGKSSGKSLSEVLIQGFRDFGYTEAVSKAKSDYNNSPSKVVSSMEKELRGLLTNTDATPEMQTMARNMLAQLGVSL